MKSKWNSCRLGDICSINSNNYSESFNWDAAYYLDTSNITENNVESIQHFDLTIQKLPSRARRLVKIGSILYSMVRPVQKHYGYIKHEQNNFLVSTGFAVIDANAHVADSYYLYCYLRQPIIEGKLQAIAEQSVSTYPTLKPCDIANLEINLPPLPTQRKIAAILSALDDKIENNNAIRKNLEEQALICFCQTFIESASNKASRPIYEFAEFINGSSFRQSELTHEGLPIIKIGELKAGISATTLRYSGDVSKKVPINDGDILFSWSGNPKTSIDVFIWCGGSGVLNQHIFKVKSLFDCPWFTYLLLKYLMPQFVSIASDKQTTGLGHVTAGDLKRLKFPHDLGKMQSFESTIAPIMLGVYNSMLENVKLLSLRDTLLPKLMRGEIDI